MKAKLRYQKGDYFSFKSPENNADEMLHKSGKEFSGSYRQDVKVTIEGVQKYLLLYYCSSPIFIIVNKNDTFLEFICNLGLSS